jgi:hypothetical protein
MLNHELISFLFDGKSPPFAEPMSQWIASSRRFAAFVDRFRDKIRKKIRVTHATEGQLDLQLELETAYLLLKEKTLSVMYEPDHAKRVVRAPDFAVTYTTSMTFMLEVTRMQTPSVESFQSIASTNNNELPPILLRVADTICSKLGQLQPRQANILLVGMDPLALTESDLHHTMRHTQSRVERDDPAFLRRYGFRDRTDFLAHFQRLSEIFMRGPGVGTSVVWVNPQAKHVLPSKVRTALYRSHNSSSSS